MFTARSQGQPGTLSINTIQNPMKYSHFLAILTQSGKATTCTPIFIANDKWNDLVNSDDVENNKAKNLVVNESKS